MRMPPRRSPQLPGRWSLLALAVFAAACDPVGGNTSAADERLRAELDVQEAVLRWAFANADTELQPPAVHCVAHVHGGPDLADPSDALLARFAADGVPVRAVSSCDGPWTGAAGRTAHPGVDLDRHFVFHPQTGQPGLLFVLHGPVELDATRNSARVTISYVQGGLWGAIWSCTAQRATGAEWRVPECAKVGDI